MAAVVVARQGDVELLHVFHAVADEPAARDRGSGLVIVVGTRVGKVDEAVLGEVRVQGHVEQPALAVRPHLRHA